MTIKSESQQQSNCLSQMEFSNAFREGTNQPPWLITAGNWKHKLFPKDVDACRKTSWPSTAAVITSRCRGLSDVGS